MAAGVPLAVASHWPLDDLNIDDYGIYHGIGKGWRKCASSVLRIPIWLGIFYVFYQEPMSMACALPAWLILDHEWILRLWKKPGYGLHARMFPQWLWSEKGLLIWMGAYMLGLWLILGRFTSIV